MFSIGLQIPAHVLPTVVSAGDSDGDDDYTPALPSDLTASHAAGPSSFVALKSESNTCTPPPKRHYVGPSLPLSQAPYNDDSDLDVRPRPLPAACASQIEGKSGVEELLEREESSGRGDQAEKASAGRVDACTSKKWRLIGIHTALDPTKARPRHEKTATSCYEVAGRKRRAANTPSEEDSGDTAKRRRRDEDICSGRPMDDQQRQKMLRNAKGLAERFGSGCSGSFLQASDTTKDAGTPLSLCRGP
ncbi:uncharacterized protein F5147DRAFT_776167 [Suillus discolor]|uniref:Uncharacterized protein n=1 Tax=Suillus discolor TaxID=1912936 RepID=A0A9P7F1W1_9AGAM|nr:uncharacterized protein F5147DRAFT_776167 [Suillus discolor]KAG2102815.1 hypothetical protein F5147DRAFT_776167 [Suillus discolor]